MTARCGKVRGEQKHVQCRLPDGHNPFIGNGINGHVFRARGWMKVRVANEWERMEKLLRQNRPEFDRQGLANKMDDGKRAKEQHAGKKEDESPEEEVEGDTADTDKVRGPGARCDCGHHRMGKNCPMEVHGKWATHKHAGGEGMEMAGEPKPEPAEEVEPPKDARVTFHSVPLDVLNAITAKKFESPLFKEIGSGVFRTVYSVEGCPEIVVKVDNGQGANKHEATAWKKMTPKQREMVAPVLWHNEDFSVLMMARAIHVGQMGNPRDGGGQAAQRIRDKLSAAGLRLQDMHAMNIGEIDGRPVVIDYGEYGDRR